MARLRFFNVNTFNLQETIEFDTITSDLTVGLHGSVNGSVKIDVTDQNRSFLSTLKEHSHYIKVNRDGFSTYGAVVSSSVIDKSVCTINLLGIYEYLQNIILFASHKINDVGDETVVNDSDQSYTKMFYCDSAIGLLHGIMLNVSKTMIAEGRDPFFDISNLRNHITTNSTQDFAKAYRLNSLEFPTVKSVIDNMLEDTEMDMLSIEVDDSNTFKWFFKVVEGYTEYIVKTTDAIQDVVFTPGEDISRTTSFAAGTNLKDEQVISKQPFDSSVAYSSFIVGNPADRTSAIGRINRNARADADKRKMQVEFTSFNTSIKLLDSIKISGPKLEEKLAVITQIEIKGREVKYTGQVVTSVNQIVKGIKKPVNKVKNELFTPISYATETSRKTAFKKPGSTGWRN